MWAALGPLLSLRISMSEEDGASVMTRQLEVMTARPRYPLFRRVVGLTV